MSKFAFYVPANTFLASILIMKVHTVLSILTITDIVVVTLEDKLGLSCAKLRTQLSSELS